MRKTILLILAFLTFGFAGTAWAQTETGQISGTIVDQRNTAVPNARITISQRGYRGPARNGV